MAVYRRGKEDYIWHFCSNCPGWPASDYDEYTSTPGTGKLCNECGTKQAGGDCRQPSPHLTVISAK